MKSLILLCFLLLKSFITCSNSNNSRHSSNFPLAFSCKKRWLERYEAESATLSEQSTTSAHLAAAIESSKLPSASLSKKNCSDFSITKLVGLPRNEEQIDSCPEFSASHESFGTVKKVQSSHESFTSAMKAFESFQTSISTRKEQKKQTFPARILKNAANPNSTENFPTSSPVQPTTSKQANSYLENLSPISPNSVDFSIGSNQNNFLCNSSSLNAKQTTEPALSQSKTELATFNSSQVILSWYKGTVGKSKFKSSHHFSKINANFYFGSNNLNDLLVFKYVASMFSLPYKGDTISTKKYRQVAIENIQIIFATVPSLNSHLKPFYYLFGNVGRACVSTLESLRALLYFLFTSISHLMQNNEPAAKEILKPLIKMAYQRLVKSSPFLMKRWDFLKSFMVQNFGFNEIGPIKRQNFLQFDETSLSFIYNEMRFGVNIEIKQFFAQVWNACKRECSYEIHAFYLCSDPELIIPSNNKKILQAFGKTMRKLYQLKFTELLLREWKSMEDLLTEYSQLKLDFESIAVDFRCRIFSRKDFKLFKSALARICLLMNSYVLKEPRTLRAFIVELEYFINFKCLLFVHDLWQEMKNGLDGAMYETTFETLKSIDFSFSEIRKYFSFNKIKLEPINLCAIQSCYHKEPFSLKILIDKIIPFIGLRNAESAQNAALFNELEAYLNNFDYIKQPLGSLWFDLSRFNYSEFVAKLEETIAGNDEQRIGEIFLAPQYEAFRKLLRLNPANNREWPLGVKKQYLEHFKTFLILYNQ